MPIQVCHLRYTRTTGGSPINRQKKGTITVYEIKFTVTKETLDRLFELKKREGKHNLTGNEFAAELLEEVLSERQPTLPKVLDE